MEQMTMFPMPKKRRKKDPVKRRWENAFQKWADEQGKNGAMSYGCCGWGSMCDWCIDNSFGRPCVRALNEMCRVKGLTIDYEKMDFERVWNGDMRGEDDEGDV